LPISYFWLKRNPIFPMINKIIAYNIPELEKKKVLSEALNLHKSKLLNDEQLVNIRDSFASKIYTPTIFLKIVFFIFSLIGISTIIGPFVAIFSNLEESGYRILFFILGVLVIYFTERLIIKTRYHFSSGITEAGIYCGLSFIAFGILGFDTDSIYLYAIVGFLMSALAAIRYLNLFALILSIFFFCWVLFQIMIDIGGIVKALMPFLFMVSFGALYWIGRKLEQKLTNIIFSTQFILISTIALLLFYVSGNYFVVRELSIKLMDFNIPEHGDIPYAFVFYIFTALVPIGYLFWGIKQKSILFIRLGMLTLALSAVTFKYYFSLGHPEILLTMAGACLIVLALVLFNYLKKIRNGFTRELLLHNKLSSQDLAAIIASQTLGGTKIAGSTGEGTVFKGGSFGGAGAGGNW
jgi:hypothetical protein